MTVEALNEGEWFTGPAWLGETENARPRVPEKLQFSNQGDPEAVMQAAVREPAFEWERFSSFKHMVRVLSYCLILKKKQSEGILTIEELNTTKLTLLLLGGKYREAYEKVSKRQPLSSSIEQIIAVSGQKLVATTTRPAAEFLLQINVQYYCQQSIMLSSS